MDAKCSLCDEMINIISMYGRHIEFSGGIACMDCVNRARERILKRELKNMQKEKQWLTQKI